MVWENYCIEVTTELDGVVVLHEEFDGEPEREVVLETIKHRIPKYDDNYGKFKYYPVNPD